MCLLNLPTMLSFRVTANNMAQAMLVPDAMSTEVDLVPVLDMVPLDLLPPLSLPSEADLLQLLQGLPSIISLESLEKRQHQKALSLEIDLNNLEQLKERVAQQGEVRDVASLASLGLQPCQVQDLPPPDAGECLHPPQQGPLCCKPCY